jgi:hypothetical protein
MNISIDTLIEMARMHGILTTLAEIYPEHPVLKQNLIESKKLLEEAKQIVIELLGDKK